MLGESRSESPATDFKWNDGEVEIEEIGLWAGQPARTRQVRKRGTGKRRECRNRKGVGILSFSRCAGLRGKHTGKNDGGDGVRVVSWVLLRGKPAPSKT
jgi:hypothetical protein